MHILTRPVPSTAEQTLLAAGIHPIEARIFAARGIENPQELEAEFKHLLPVDALKGAPEAAKRLADAIARQEHILIVADYDADGATACAVGLRGLSLFGARVEFLVPNRFEYGYGLTPEIVDLAAHKQPQLIVTVDNGIASVAGVARAHELGIEVLVTDHHLPGDSLPDALIVNPNQPGCPFPSKNLAGVGVMFYVLLALRAELRTRQAFADKPEPNLADLLDLVALGTVADVVRLDNNNRILVEQGLKRMRAGRACAGILAIFQAAGREIRRASAFDLGFMVGPRLNAAGRLDDMSLGIACLVADSSDAALAMARELDQLNRERRGIEAEMQNVAEAKLDAIAVDDRYSLTVFDPDFHQGVVGLVASRLKDRHHRPTIVFAAGMAGEIKGSGRSIPGLHLRDALDLVAKRESGLIAKFGGHAMAAGLTLADPDGIERFRASFEAACRLLLSETELTRTVEVDGELGQGTLCLDLAERLDRRVWGQGFPAPRFIGRFRVCSQRVVGEKHLKLQLEGPDGERFEAMRFQHAEPLPEKIEAVYQLSVNEWQGRRSLQLLVEQTFGQSTT
ncbi:single-stranded-DNA-specific exonuclease RecJ [Chitinimonas sp. BJB300]|uniref:single-stranded-DNA-specific exonuclease RecJ n=1 Tax=Chitinimonas sp. BJB300 TaxID=1559339 RepID=UPI000C1045B9|nr:single-stranded-DNA-specific exonuclease RecJ [Chitinimonas sp. BJB300]PHV13339.1 single-stranded-DNA-specific exonuclease RecJ [Chitinimonas sp. BJB300]TSJ85256.1 single-stranded-DNA-specific exonuclease RecJ [Chitinimonas sp. BJB300]